MAPRAMARSPIAAGRTATSATTHAHAGRSCRQVGGTSHVTVLFRCNAGTSMAGRARPSTRLRVIAGTVYNYSMSDLTPRQANVLRVIQRSLNETGMPPTRAEIANELGFRSPNAAEEHLRALARKGVIQLLPGASRGIQLRDTMREQLALPLVGRVAAGRPMLAEEHILEHLQIDPAVFHPRPHYLLKVVGMSMKDAGILDGDLVAVHRTSEVRNRQIIVARLENEVTVKRYKQEGNMVWLLRDNAEFEPIRIDLAHESMLIAGVVVGVLRRGVSGTPAVAAGSLAARAS